MFARAVIEVDQENTIRERRTGKVLVTVRGESLAGADLRGTNLAGADLRGQDLRATAFTDADLRGADLEEADLGYADLRRADLRDAQMRSANLVGAVYDGRTHWPAGLDPKERGARKTSARTP